ncbi:hypothetical protein [Mesorhizobium sp.]|uniref:hypothetical protein n=1 Tax=Mesorhizobium sp. TaxID=1871066 RepID=UPI0011FE9962|nr:hypothetical protein [Mesorhizobium sp.]TIN79763.1 MAG: hypothetical protein E5Y09_04825 [Mesorhizobium sp.]
MTRLSIAEELEIAADQIADVSRADLQVMLRRAALVLRNVTGIVLEPNVDESLVGLAAEMGASKSDLIKTIVGDWLVTNAYLPVPCALDEESSVDGNA